jgi:hypothetical protein
VDATGPVPQRGVVAPGLRREYGRLDLWWAAVDVAPRARDDGRARCTGSPTPTGPSTR